MNAAHLVVQVALVLLGIFLYDLVRERDESTSRTSKPPIERSTPGTPPRSVVLGGDEAVVLDRRIGHLAVRMDGFEEAIRVLRERVQHAPPASQSPWIEPIPVAVPHDAKITAEGIARFRALEEAARRQRQAEQLYVRLTTALDGLGVNLDAGERQRILEETTRIWQRVQTTARQLADARVTQADRQAAFDELSASYEIAIDHIVPGSHASAIAERLAPLIGLGMADRLDRDHDGREDTGR